VIADRIEGESWPVPEYRAIAESVEASLTARKLPARVVEKAALDATLTALDDAIRHYEQRLHEPYYIGHDAGRKLTQLSLLKLRLMDLRAEFAPVERAA
jgi:hypothetical protein